MIGSKEFAWCSAEPFARGRTMHAQFQVCNLNTAISSPEGVMSQYSTLARNGPGRRREDLAQRTPRNAGMSDTVESLRHRINQFSLNPTGFEHLVALANRLRGKVANLSDADGPETLGFVKVG
jgi:hypothetical protein